MEKISSFIDHYCVYRLWSFFPWSCNIKFAWLFLSFYFLYFCFYMIEIFVIDKWRNEVSKIKIKVHMVFKWPLLFAYSLLLFYFLFHESPSMTVINNFMLFFELFFVFQFKVFVGSVLRIFLLLFESEFTDWVFDKFGLHHFMEVKCIVERRNGVLKWSLKSLYFNPYFWINVSNIVNRLTIDTHIIFWSVFNNKAGMLANFLINFLKFEFTWCG